MYVFSLRTRRYQFRRNCKIWPKSATIATETKRPLGLTQQIVFSKGLEFYLAMFSDCLASNDIGCGPDPSCVDLFFRRNELSLPATNKFGRDSANFPSGRNLLYSATTVRLVHVGVAPYEY